ncbi:MAG: DUF2802 domain-containing protein [Firmicutes bacterium]|nr:DUF2802 domain-containing protein [Bacillota bacterium]
MPYLLLLLGLGLAFLAAAHLKNFPQDFFAERLYGKSEPFDRDLTALLALQELMENNLRELQEKNEMLQYLLVQLEKQRESSALQLQQVEDLLRQFTNSAAPTSMGPANDGRKEQVYKLIDQGFSTAEVAAELGLGRGEVELILGLRRVKN